MITKVIGCPTCGKNVEWSENNRFRPFCCERCKLIDFGDWASEKHTIAGESVEQIPENENEGIQ